MINQKVLIVNGQPQIVNRHAIYTSRPTRLTNLQIQPNRRFTSAPQQIRFIEGIPVVDQYEPEKGDPIVIQQAIFRGQVIKQGDKQKEVINQQQAIVSSQGYASQDGEVWKFLPKIIMTVFKLGKIAIQTVSKVKAKFDKGLLNHKIMKITSANTDYYLGFRNDVFDEWFLKFVWAKLLIQKRQCSQFDHQQKQIKDKIYKKSQFLGEWQLRVVSIDSQRGLKSYKESSNSASLEIDSTKQIWTRFQQIKGGYYLVIKLWYGILKIQFAVPTITCLRWLHHFLSLLQPE